MPDHPSPASAARPLTRRTLLGLLGLVAVLGAVVAAMLTLASPTPGSFGRYLVFSECISLAITGWNMALRRMPGLRRLGMPRDIGVAMVAAAPLGYATGYSVAAAIWNEPLRIAWLDHGSRLSVLATVLASSLVTALFWLRHHLLVEAAARSEAQRLAAEAQLRLLRAQLEPHMLFNTLATLRSLVDVDPAQAQRMIDQLITYLRSSLAASRNEATTLQLEFAQARAYLDIMALRMGPRMSYSLALPENLQGISVPPMLLQPLVENAIKHGIEPKVGSAGITVEARAMGDFVELSITDSGLGLPPDDATPHAGQSYGLLNVRERLSAVYGSAASLTLHRHLPQGVRATVRIPR